MKINGVSVTEGKYWSPDNGDPWIILSSPLDPGKFKLSHITMSPNNDNVLTLVADYWSLPDAVQGARYMMEIGSVRVSDVNGTETGSWHAS